VKEKSASHDEKYMARALSLARRGLGRTSPNPAVGAVVVNGGRIVGEGYHLWERKTHAEVIALERAGSKARGGDIYVTLEPCSHHGRTPPCADAIIASGIKNVYVAVEDPDPRVSGRGIRKLRKAALNVKVGLRRREALRVNEAYFFSVENSRPLVSLKLAMTMDARIATSSGESQWITGDRARHYAHRLRYLNDAVLVGSGTFKSDNPSLTVRWNRKKRITRVVLDSSASCISPGSRILESEDPVLVFHNRGRKPGFIPKGDCRIEYLGVPVKSGLLSWPHILEKLGERNIRSLLAEGGGEVAGSLIRSGYVDRLCLFYSPMFIGSEGFPAIGGLGVERLDDSFRFKTERIVRLGKDFCVEAKADNSV